MVGMENIKKVVDLEILINFAVPLQFSTFMKKRYSKDQISEPQDFE